MTRLTGNDAWMRLAPLLAAPDVKGTNDPRFEKWKQDCLRLISRIDGERAPTLRSFEGIDFEGNSFGVSVSEADYQKHFRECLEKAQAILESIHGAVLDEMHMELQQSASSTSNKASNATSPTTSKKVFVVHGHDEKMKVQVARFLERLQLQPIILHEQPDQGQTIIEKFEKHSDVSFAVVLLTPDDVGGVVISEALQKPRARQNVIFEFGFFLGKLGRANVCGLYCEGVELPSDYSGVLYTKVDNEGAWQFKLLRELKAAGFVVDANRLS